MNKYKFYFTLIQHTPIIHHLGKETWSGLQSKAITPMLNRFLAERKTGKTGKEAESAFRDMFKKACGICGDKVWNAGACMLSQEEDGETGKCRAGKEGGCEFAGWFRNKKELESIAFNYNLSFECKVDEKAWYTGKTMMQDRAHVLYENRQVHGAISCSSKGLQKFIVDSLSEFFILTGLGYNSSKGFGCFSLSDITIEEIQNTLYRQYLKNDQAVFFQITNNQAAINTINKQWKYIKGGINFPDRNIYFKSLLWEYFCGQDKNVVGWEKRFIKEALKENCQYDLKQLKSNPSVNNGEMRFETTHTPANFQFFRLLLGLAEKYEYRLKDRDRITNKTEISISVKPKNKNIERIPSPVRFKVFFDTIFIVVDSVNEILRGSEFEFYYKGKALSFKGINSLGIQIPQNGLRECFESILLNTAIYSKPGEQHPLCGKYQQLTAQESK